MINEEPTSVLEEITRVEQHQTFKPDRVSSQDALTVLIGEIATKPDFYSAVIKNPYSLNILQVISRQFPQAAQADVIRAFFLAEPESTYDISLRELPRKQKREKLYEQIDTSAEITMRLSRYIDEHAQEFWDLEPEQLYEVLAAVAFGDSEPEEIDKKYSRSQRRGFRLSIANFIDDLQKLKPHKEEFETDARAKANKLLNKEFQGKVEAESLPVGFIIYLDEDDYAKFEGIDDTQGFDSDGVTLFWKSLPQELIGKIVLVNTGGPKRGLKSPDKIKQIRDHEMRHIFFGSFLAEDSTIRSFDTEEAVTNLFTFEDHQAYAIKLRKSLYLRAKDEIIAYYCTGNREFLNLSKLDGDQWAKHLEEIKTHLWVRDDIEPAEKVRIFDLYQNQRAQYLEQIREFQWIAQKLFAEAEKQEQDFEHALQSETDRLLDMRGGTLGITERVEILRDYRERFGREEASERYDRLSSEETTKRNKARAEAQQNVQEPKLTIAKAEALLQNTPPEKIRRLTRYFGIDSKDVVLKQAEERQQLVENLSDSVDRVTQSSNLLAKLRHQLSGMTWSKKSENIAPDGWSIAAEIKLMKDVKGAYPVEAMPLLLKLIRVSDSAFNIEESIDAVEIILQMNYQSLTHQDISKIKQTLEKFLKRKNKSDEDFSDAKTKAEKLVRTIDEIYLDGGLDFIRNEPLVAKVARIMKTDEGQSPSIAQLSVLVDTLSGEDSDTWWRCFGWDHIGLLKTPDGIPILLKMSKWEASNDIYFTGIALEYLENMIEHLTKSQKTELLKSVSDILTIELEEHQEVLEKVKVIARSIKTKLA